MFTNLSYAFGALIETFKQYGQVIASLKEVTLKDNVYYVDLRPNTGFLAVNVELGEAYRVAQIGNPKGLDSNCAPEFLAWVLQSINHALNK